MSNFTKKAIKETFWELLEKELLSQISVRDIAQACGINRNSFYYHFRDIPSLVEEIVVEAADTLVQKYPNISSIDEVVEVAFNFTLENRNAYMQFCESSYI